MITKDLTMPKANCSLRVKRVRKLVTHTHTPFHRTCFQVNLEDSWPRNSPSPVIIELCIPLGQA